MGKGRKSNRQLVTFIIIQMVVYVLVLHFVFGIPIFGGG